ncbi:extracellular solute-binding protein [Thiospirochaeta perfilievii]|uniref:Extracellular solute-binding protein n=1 Tax=Thiospirochaeta perfilievii TaxID=252967 RepID=A0A5C1QJG0_9SPIO|nr:extracellular solute-binding protein [Thiospirochaeta perfilievii]QEN06302.1 extracellular solute-binding protein [Thiospirochaeta perfilievii]
MKKAILFILTVLMSFQFLSANSNTEAASDGNVSIEMWTKEGDADGTLQWTMALIEQFMAENPTITVEVVKKTTVDELREDFQTASLAGETPDLLWTVSDHAGPFLTADLIQSVDGLVDLSKFVETVTTAEGSWAVPMSSGNHLMLIYNKDLIQTPPTTTDELIAMGTELTTDDMYGLVYNQTEPFWFVPWLGGFNGKVFAADGVTPTLNTKEMVNALQFVSDLKNKYAIVPQECDYNAADTLFKEGKAAMIINGDWSLGDYEKLFGDKLGVTRIPMVSATKKWPAPYTAGIYLMVPKDIDAAKAKAAAKLIEFFTSKDVQYSQVNDFNRLPGLKAAYDAPKIKESSILKGSSYQLEVGTPMPTVLEMRAVWDGIKPELAQVLAGNISPADAAELMQESAVAGIAAQQ